MTTASEPLPAPTRTGLLADNPRPEIIIGGAVAFAFFVLFLGWAAFVPLDAGAYAPGKIVVSGSRQAVQHRDGGIVSALHVSEGDHVVAGQVLVEIAGPDLRATERGLAAQVFSLQAQRARLIAEREGRSVFTPPAEFFSLQGDDKRLADEAVRLQQLQFRARGSGRSTQTGVLNQRVAQLTDQIEGYQRQIDSNREQARLISEELAGTRSLAERGYAPVTRVRALERAAADLDGTEGQLRAQIAAAGEAIGETRLQMNGVDTTLGEEVADQLRQIEVSLNELQPRLAATRDEIARAQVRAPATGRVIGLSTFTVGGVIQGAQTLMEIVPDDARLVIDARVSPNDADDLAVGQPTQIRFAAFHERALPILHGKLEKVSPDAFTDEQSGRSFFRAQVSVPASELQRLRDGGVTRPLQPGLEVEVVVPTRKRTALSYLIEPLTHTLWKSGREA
ncbi:secretion protein HylD [Brevundimonas sp. Leaf363]|uniref:HlyD family type I secretion periplasmic adaptor subunit n=1 Tax=Brevundimonas sp. Leaf363 TaxID=1736353 RepID=UPI0006FDA2AC|nr:HlyD family type I secretion periplasmic adaptor subunit [Brevundimonas sp. Leaf363]KQS55563.1 secretion protein HylD [Brevundimonas sp. Leaf363]